MKDLSKPALKSVLNNEIKFHPKKYVSTYKYWMDNVRDWNISRQLYWGHRIPVYYLKNDSSKYVVAKNIEEAFAVNATPTLGINSRFTLPPDRVALYVPNPVIFSPVLF